MNKLEKIVLTKIFENHLIVKNESMTIEKLTKITDETKEELYKIISILLIKKHIRMIHTNYHWTVNPFAITEKGSNSLEVNWRRRILDSLIPIAILISIIAIFYNPT